MIHSSPIASTIITIFGLQAIVLIVLLLRKQPVKQSSFFLSALLFFFAIMVINIALLNILITHNKIHLFKYFQLELFFGFGPSLYFFTKSITDSNYRISRKEYVHFIPVLIEFIYFRTEFYRIGFDNRMVIYQNSTSLYHSDLGHYSIVYLIQQWVGIISILIYMFFSLRLLLRYNQWIKTRFSNLKNKSLGWLQIPIFFYSSFWVAWIILRTLDMFVYQDALKEIYFLPSFIGLSISTCWMGFKVYVKSQPEAIGFSKTPIKSVQRNYKPDEVEKILSLMESQKLFLNPDLDLAGLSEHLNMNPKATSQLINHALNTNFYEFINKYRVEEFKYKLQQENWDKFSILGLAYDCGFNSKSTFNHTFKKFTGKTPREYYNQCKNKSERKLSDFI